MKLLVLPALFRSRHADPRLQAPWDVLQLAVLILPFSSLLGSLGFVGVAIALWTQRFDRIIRRPVNQALAVLTLLLLISTGFAFQPEAAAIGLVNFLPFFWVFAGLSELLQTADQVRRLAQMVVFASIPVVWIGLGQQFCGWSGHVQWLWILADWNVAPTGNPPGRMASLFYYANVLASYLVITLLLNLGLWIEARRLPKASGPAALAGSLRTNLWLPRPTPYFLGLTIALVGNALALIFTNSRNAWSIAVLAGIAFAIYLRWRLILVGMGAMVTVILGAAFAPAPINVGFRRVVPAFFWARLNDQMYPNRPLGDRRSTQWQFAWELVQQRPCTGWGLRNFSPLYEAKMQFFIAHPHNLFLMLAAETGWPATILLFAIVGWITLQGSLRLLPPRSSASPARRNSRPPFPQPLSPSASLLGFTLLTTFVAVTLFSFLDITLFDVRINLLGWLLLAGIHGASIHGMGQSGKLEVGATLGG